MKNVIGLIFLLTLLSCNKDDDKGIFSYDFVEKSKIDVSTDPKFPIKFRDWENTTFNYSYQNMENQEDPSWTQEAIIFEIPQDLEVFSYTDNELIAQNTFFLRSCLCPDIAPISIQKGSISGKKIDLMTWEITMNVSFTDSGTLTTKNINESFLNTIRFSF
jgi:hypothetical protein